MRWDTARNAQRSDREKPQEAVLRKLLGARNRRYEVIGEMKLPLDDILKQAKELQERFGRLQKELEATEVVGESGGGVVRVTMTGNYVARRVHIDPSLLADDRAMLEDLLTAALNDATRRIEGVRQEKLGSAAGGMTMPPGFGALFGA